MMLAMKRYAYSLVQLTMHLYRNVWTDTALHWACTIQLFQRNNRNSKNIEVCFPSTYNTEQASSISEK